MKKTNYETPQAELIVVRFEESFMASRDFAPSQIKQGNTSWWLDEEEED